MFVRCNLIAQGPGPSEAIVGIRTADGRDEEVVLSGRQVRDGSIDVGAALLVEADRYLIELPRESASGRWRIWVGQDQVIRPEMAA